MTNIRIGTFIADLRKEQSLTQEQLAERLGVSNRSISRWENGNTLPDYSLMQALAIVLGISLSELLAGQRLPEDDKTEACVQLALELSKRERDTLRRTLNRCFGFGLTSILCGILFCSFTETPQVFFLLCCGLGIAFIITGLRINNRKAAAIDGSLLTAEDSCLRMTTASEMLLFSMKRQQGHKRQHRKAFEALSAALAAQEYARFSMIADSCTIDGQPGPWHIAISITNKRILFCAEVMRGAFLPVYPVESYACLCFDSAKLCGRKLVLHLQNTVIQLEGHGFDAVWDGLQAFICP